MKIYFTIAGTNHHHGQEFMEKDMPVHLEKEPDNEHDKEAIKVMMDGLATAPGACTTRSATPPRARSCTCWTRASCAG